MTTLPLKPPQSSAAAPQFKVLTPFQLAWRRFRRNKMGYVGIAIVAGFMFISIFANFLAPYDYDRTNLSNVTKQPGTSMANPLGTDDLGRDQLSRLIYGARTSFIVATTAQVVSLVIGVVLGLLSGWYGGWVDFAINRIIELVGSLPGLLFQILLMTLLGNGIAQVTFVIAVLSWPGMVRLVRAQVLSYKERDFVTASTSLGASTPFVMLRHVMPNIMNPLIVAISFGVPGFITAEAGLSFLGYGINEPIPSWGKMVGKAGQWLASPNFHYLMTWPTGFLATLVLGFAFLGDALRDALDPSSDRV
jgi:ABC-type dipeptide/oligopeptide/nickel transport system permease subunit